MNSDEKAKALVLDERVRLSLGELCRTCGVSAEYVVTLVQEGLIEPDRSAGREGGRPQEARSGHRRPEPGGWCFSAHALRRVRQAARLQRDLELNLAGAVLAVELLEEMHHLRRRLRLLEDLLED